MGAAPLHFDVGGGLSPEKLDAIRNESSFMLEALTLSSETKYAACVVIEELCTNVLEHSEAVWLELALAATPSGLEIRLSDNGNPFNPTELFSEVNIDPDISEFTNRQLGIYMVRRMASSLHYQREASGLNCLTVGISQGQK